MREPASTILREGIALFGHRRGLVSGISYVMTSCASQGYCGSPTDVPFVINSLDFFTLASYFSRGAHPVPHGNSSSSSILSQMHVLVTVRSIFMVDRMFRIFLVFLFRLHWCL